MITRAYLPRAKEISLPNMTEGTQVYEDLAHGKADVAIHDPILFSRYNKNNPGQLRRAFFETCRGLSYGICLIPP